jgi:para-aminobenzoate synthetase component 1
MNLHTFIEKANYYGAGHTPFIFIIDFELQKPLLFTLKEAVKQRVYYQVKIFNNINEEVCSQQPPALNIFPIDYQQYKKAFNLVMENLLSGNTYLLNLTFPTIIETKVTLWDIFFRARATYKLNFKDQFIVFSPECFVKTRGNYIFSYPMKGTIDADLPNAAKQIMENKKEEWEHNTITDLIRNDLAMVSKNVTVIKSRFISEIRTNRKNLLQVSSEIRGELPQDWQHSIGQILATLLPAGSISGAPKQKTVEIIKQAEKINREYFTGIFGLFDGKDIDSAVNIRFIEKTLEGLQFRSGGGITANSNPKDEYIEMLDKVYVPTI